MKSVTFLHIADLHLDSPFIGLKTLPEKIYKRVRESTFLSFSRLVSLAIRERVDFVVIAGDIFDQENRSIRAQSRFRKEMQRLESSGIEVYLIHGNHDHLGGDWYDIKWPSNVHVFSSNGVEMLSYMKSENCKVNLYGFSYPKRAVHENMTNQYSRTIDGDFHIGILHGSIEGDENHNHYAPFRLEELRSKGFDYWALGHIHKRQVLSTSPMVVYPGNIQGRHRKESDEKGGYIVQLTDAGAKITFHHTAEISWDELTINIEELHELAELMDKISLACNEVRKNAIGVFLSIKLIGHGPLHPILQNKETLDDLLQAMMEGEDEQEHFVYITTVSFKHYKSKSREDLDKEVAFIKDLSSLVETYENFNKATKSLYHHPNARRYLEPLTLDEQNEIIAEAEQLLLNAIAINQSKGEKR
ncbi:metallophosphoesterase family protein [Litchfieldia alkalitelluris]|uniref:metallophosphoesterase family protein n=1 Tax=Litchfieldia alkalitelluris TaxID=304268 RepID=UPI0009972BA7|nr:DNA repair exonuclease [Litchfieldia alkalitelluris]